MRIIIAGTVHYPALNGQAVFTENLAKGLAARGHEVLSILPSDKGAAYQTTLDNVRIEALKSVNLNKIHAGSNFSLFSRISTERILRDFKPDVVHIQDHFPISWDVVNAARQLGHKLVGTNHFMPENLAAYVPVISKIKPVYRRIMWEWMLKTYNQLDIVTAQSKASAALLRSQGLRVPVFPVSCGINLQRFTRMQGLDRSSSLRKFGLDPARKTFLFVGRVDKEKRLEVLIRALASLERTDIQLVIAGQGAAQNSLQTLSKELNLNDRVHFLGFVSSEDLPQLLNSVDIFTMPSEAELLSIASLEAMACGRPVLMANAVALPELVTEGMNGYLFRPGDYQDAARCMALLADHPERWPAMGLVSQEKARYHGMENTIKQYESIYTALLAGSYDNSKNMTSGNMRNASPEFIGSKK